MRKAAEKQVIELGYQIGARKIADMVEKQVIDEFTKALCLETECSKYIHVAKTEDSGRWFCDKHKLIKKSYYPPAFDLPEPASFNVPRGYDNFPLFDREGDAIWIQKGFNVVKIREMEDSHLTNTLVFLETNAKKRCELTGLPIEKWQAKAGVRYNLLLDEAKLRDAGLKCNCDDGIMQLEITDPQTLVKSTETSLCGNCVRGEDRRKAKQLANLLEKDTAKRKRSLVAQVALMMLVALMAGGAYARGIEFTQLVTSYMSK